MPFNEHLNPPQMAENGINGNHLLHAFAFAHPGYDIYLQAFVTAPTLTGPLIRHALAEFLCSDKDSFATATVKTGFFWYQGKPVNQSFTPAGLPRTQDAQLVQETTGLYGIRREPLLRTGCRITADPLFVMVPAEAAIDIDTDADWLAAEKVLSNG
jgi:N-acylneuraminate cytidylyltransferase